MSVWWWLSARVRAYVDYLRWRRAFRDVAEDADDDMPPPLGWGGESRMEHWELPDDDGQIRP